MRAILPSVSIESETTYEQLLRLIEKAGRVCYKSEDKIGEGSAEKFIKGIISRGHEAVLEHGTITVKVICDRGVTHEVVRHRIGAYCQESTRYVDSGHFKNKTLTQDDIIRLYKAGLTVPQIYAKKDNSYALSSIESILSRKKVHKEDQLDYRYFDVIDSPRKAYLLGLIQADGNVRKNRNSYILFIDQNKDEMWYIEALIRTEIGQKYHSCSGEHPNGEKIQITNEHLVTSLFEKGIIPNKTYAQTEAEIKLLWSSIPLEYKWDFIHGLFDGDGTIKFGNQITSAGNPSGARLGICGNEFLLNYIKSFIMESVPGDYVIGIDKKETYANLRITHQDYIREICKKMLSNGEIPFSNPHKTADILKNTDITLSLSQFGEENFYVVIPSKMSKEKLWSELEHWIWLAAMYKSEDSYSQLRLLGWTPQEARAVLPNSLKTEIFITYNIREWRHFLKLRTGKGAHPDMRLVAGMILSTFKENFPLFFEDIEVEE